MDVPSKCTIVKAMGRSAYTPEVLNGRIRTQKPKRKKRMHYMSVKLSLEACKIRKSQFASVNPYSNL
jgi:hypothetical protein